MTVEDYCDPPTLIASGEVLAQQNARLDCAMGEFARLARGLRPMEYRPAPVPLACSRYFAAKPWLDRLLVLLLAIPAALLIGVIALLVLITCGRPIFYCQARVGRRGKQFTIWKIRTMCRDAERVTGPIWCGPRDPRITSIGHWLRITHLDELPQLWNVIWGNMSLIGPRPERPEIAHDLAQSVPDYSDRLTVLPGITGWAQIHQASDVDLASVRSKQVFDLEYIRCASLRMDLQILIETIPRLFGLYPRTLIRSVRQRLGLEA